MERSEKPRGEFVRYQYSNTKSLMVSARKRWDTIYVFGLVGLDLIFYLYSNIQTHN